MTINKFLLMGVMSFIVISSLSAFADSLGIIASTQIYTFNSGTILQQDSDVSYNSLNAIVQASSHATGSDVYGRTYMSSAMSKGGLGGFHLVSSARLSGGNPQAEWGLASEATAGFNLYFTVPAGVYSYSVSVTAYENGVSTTGHGQTYGWAQASGPRYCFFYLSGGTQSCTTPINDTHPGDLTLMSLSVEVTPSVYYSGDSAGMSYTFLPTAHYYDADGNLVGQYSFPPPPGIPEPSTFLMLGSGFVGLTRAVRRKLSS
jgi:hypothetical protein